MTLAYGERDQSLLFL